MKSHIIGINTGGISSDAMLFDALSAQIVATTKKPAHELVTEKAIGMIDPKPVFCSHRISRLTDNFPTEREPVTTNDN